MAQNCENGPRPTKKPKMEKNEVAEQGQVNNDLKLVRIFCEDLFPGFQEFLKNSNSIIPSTKNIYQEIFREEYIRTRSVLVNNLASVHHVAVTIDNWKLGVTGRRIGRSMWTATLHFVYQGKLVSQILFTKEANLRKDDNIAREIKSELNQFKVFRKVVCFITSSGKNSVLKDAAMYGLHIPHVPCVASTLNLIIQEVFNFLNDHTGLEKYKNTEDEPFSWHSPYIKLKDIIENNSGNFAPSERKELGECFQIIKPFEEFNNTLSREQYLTLSYIIPLVNGLKLRIRQCSPFTALAVEFKDKVEASIDKHFKIYENEIIAAMATFMDPRFKNAAFTQEKADFVQKTVIQELMECEKACHQQNPAPSTSNMHSGETGNLLGYLVDHKNIKPEPNERNVTSCGAQAAVEHYVGIPDSNPNDDPYQFWEEFNRVSKCSQFYIMSQKYLCIPATAIPVQSTSGQFLWKKNYSNNINFIQRRNLLEAENISEILFLHSYYSKNK